MLNPSCDAGAKLFDPAGIVSHAAIAGREIARGKIEQHLLELVAPQLVRDGAAVVLVGEQELDGLKTGRLGACEAFQKWMLREEHRQIGRKFRHLASSTPRPARPGAS